MENKPTPKELVLAMSKIGCTNDEMAIILKISTEELVDKYSDEIKEGNASLNMSLRKKQVEIAIKGNPNMLMWLGKNMLKQAEKTESIVISQDVIDTEVASEKIEKLLEDLDEETD